MCGATVYSGMLEAPKYMHGATVFLCPARRIEVCTAADQPFTRSCSEHRSMHGATVYSVMLGASKYARSNRLLSHARSNRRLLSHARSTEVCTEQPYTQSCSEHRSMHGATVYLVVLGASEYARSKCLLSRARSIESMHG